MEVDTAAHTNSRYIGATVTSAHHKGTEVVFALNTGATITAHASDKGSTLAVTGTLIPDSPIAKMLSGGVGTVSFIGYESGERTEFLSSGVDTHVYFLLN